MSFFLPNWVATAVGSTIFAARPLSERELAHELIHVEQWRRYGIAFLPRYYWSSFAAWRAGGHWYFDNAFEVEARG